MYLPKSQYKILSDGSILTSTGEKFKVPADELARGFFGKAKKLTTTGIIDLSDIKTIIDLKNNVIEPTESDYNFGSYVRYFIKDMRTNKIYEVSLDTYNDEKNKTYNSTLEIEWIIKGPIEDTSYGAFIFKGAKNRNIDYINKAKIIMPGIENVLNNPLQFVNS